MSFVTENLTGLITLVFLVGVVFFLIMKFMVNVGSNEIAIIERQFVGKELEKGRVFALETEVGLKANYLSPGLHFIMWPLTKLVDKYYFVSISSDELGIIEATDGNSLPPGRIFAEDPAGNVHDNFQDPVAFIKNGGIRGKQLRFLTNGTFKIHPALFKVTKIKKTFIPEGSIGVVTATDGGLLPSGQLLGRSVEGHDNFQNADVFLKQGGQKGPQTDFLRPGTYNINTEIFVVEHKPAVQIAENEIGIVEARDGQTMKSTEVVVATPEGHNNFQDGQKFLDAKGKRGPQETVLTPGTYYINPYLFSVSKRNQTVVAQGQVAVLISNIGKDPSDFSNDNTVDAQNPRHVVPRGYRGIQKDVMGPGAYNINPLAYAVIIIPTTTRSVDWSGEGDRDQPSMRDNLKDNLTVKMGTNKIAPSDRFDPFQVVSHDGFPMQVEVRCQYRILPENAPYVVQKLGSIKELEANVIHPQIDGIFRAQVSRSPAIAYQQNRAEEQKAAEEAVKADLNKYRVEVVSVMITNIHLPEQLMKTTQQKNLAEQEKSMFDAKKDAEQRRIEFEKTKAEADAQLSIITAESGIKVAKHEASQMEERARGDAARVRMSAEAEATKTRQIGDAEAAVVLSKGEAIAKAYREQVAALTAQGVTAVEVTKAIAAAGLKITPDIMVNGSDSGSTGSGGLMNVLLARMLVEPQAQATKPIL